MSTKKYATFLKVVELGSITKAAEALGHTQSGVTQLMRSLEEDLGVSLFNRSRAGITLTKQGETLLPFIEKVMTDDAALRRQANQLSANTQNTLRIGTFTSVAVNVLPALFQGYKKIDPGTRFEMRDIGYNNIEEILSKEDLDFCFVALPLSLDCKCIPLYEDRLLAVTAKDHPLAGKRFPLAQFEKEPVISLIKELNQDAQQVWEANHITPNIQYITKDDYAMIAMAEKGLGICILPELLVKDSSKDVALMELDPPAYRTLAIAFPPHKQISENALRFAEFAKAQMKEIITF